MFCDRARDDEGGTVSSGKDYRGACFAGLFARHHEAAFRRALQLSRSRSDAMDLVHDAFERAIRHLPPDTNDLGFRAWINVAIRNLFLDQCKTYERRYRCVVTDDEIAAIALEGAPEPARWESVKTEELRAAILRLDPHLRRVLELRVDCGLSQREIATQLGIRPGTVGSRLSRARQRLRECLSPCSVAT